MCTLGTNTTRSRLYLLAGALAVCLGGSIAFAGAGDVQESIVGDDGPLPVVAIGTRQCAVTAQITGGSPDGSSLAPMHSEDVLEGFRERLAQALLNTGSVQLMEHGTQSLMDEEIRKRIARGEDPSTVITEVAREFKVSEYLSVTNLEVYCEYEHGIFGWNRRTKGSGRAVGSFISVATGATVKKPEAEVPYLSLRNAQPPAWISEVTRQLANELVGQRYPIPPIKVVKVRVEGPDVVLFINRGKDGGILPGRRYLLRDPSESILGEILPGQQIGEITVTDRVGPRIAEAQLGKVLRTITDRNGKVRTMTVLELAAYIGDLLHQDAPPEVTEQ